MSLTKRRIIENGIIFLMGAVGYYLLEVLWRGFSHWTMALAGGLCFTILYFLANSNRLSNISLFKKCLIGSISITAVELSIGIIVNKWLMWNVWDYSDQYFNFMGQICLLFSLVWFFLCFPALYLCRACKKAFFEKRGNEGTAATADKSVK